MQLLLPCFVFLSEAYFSFIVFKDSRITGKGHMQRQYQEKIAESNETYAMLQDLLDEEESVLWSGRPGQHSSQYSPNTPGLLIMAGSFGIVALLMLALGFALLITLPMEALIPFYALGVTFAFLAILFGILGAVIKVVPRAVHYAITSKRVLIINRGRTLTVHSYSWRDIGPVTFIERPDGSGDLIFARTPYGYTASNGNSNLTRGRFSGIPNVREAERVLRHLLDRAPTG
jgi:hypothetical protein